MAGIAPIRARRRQERLWRLRHALLPLLRDPAREANALAERLLVAGLADDGLCLSSERWQQRRQGDVPTGEESAAMTFASQELPGLLPRQPGGGGGLQGAADRAGCRAARSHPLEHLVEAIEAAGVHAEDLRRLPLRALTRMTTATRYPSRHEAPRDLARGTSPTKGAATHQAFLVRWSLIAPEPIKGSNGPCRNPGGGAPPP